MHKGTMYARTVISVPVLKGFSKVKYATLASWNDVTLDDAKHLKERFIKSNDEFEPNQFHFKFVPYSTLI